MRIGILTCARLPELLESDQKLISLFTKENISAKAVIWDDESVDWTYFESAEVCHEALKALGYTVYCIEQVDQSISLHDFKPEAGNKYAFVFGNEVDGVSDEVIQVCDGVIEIPQWGMKHSLNISVAAALSPIFL